MIETPTTYAGVRPPIPSLEWLQSPARPALQVASSLERVRRAPAILPAMRAVPKMLRVIDEAVRDGIGAGSLLEPVREAIDDDVDTVTALAAVHALGRVPGAQADVALAELILDGRPGFEEHAIWALAERPAMLGLIRALAQAVARGGMSGMHAQAVLSRWSATHAGVVLVALESALAEATTESARRYLVETVGLVQGHAAHRTLERIATDPADEVTVRATAIAAFAERTTERLPDSIAVSSRSNAELRAALHVVRGQRQLSRRGPRRPSRRSTGISIAQIHLGETGGLATLLPQLGDALAGQQRVAGSITIGRSQPGVSVPVTDSTASSRQELIPLAAGEGSTFNGAWPSVVVARRGIRAALLRHHLPNVMHLRMADPGSMAGAAVARELGIPFVFTLAPDPHGPIAAAEGDRTLDRRSFADEDARAAYWFRANLVARLARDARELVLFPRQGLHARIEALTGIDLADGPPRHTVVPEGIDTARAAAAAAVIESADETRVVVAELERAVSLLPPARHGLPLLVSVGRLHRVKGMSRLVEAFATHDELQRQANLLIVGGDLERPSAHEAAELARIRALFVRYPGLKERVIMLGQRPNRDVSLLLAAARAGWGPLIGPAGAYVCASEKEEFGLAIVEAMAAGLAVAAPRNGGPATYVEDGMTGTLIDTADIADIAAGAREVLRLARRPETATRSRKVVNERFTLERMARTLAAVYRISAGASTLAHPVEAEGEVEVEVAA